MTNIPPNINLLAWRAEQQSKQLRKFALLIFNAAMLAVISIIIFHVALLYQIQHIDSEVAILQQQINQQNLLRNEIIQIQNQKNQFVPRINELNILQYDRQQITQLLNELSNITPAGIYLTSLSRQNQQISLVGKSVSSAQLAVLMQNISQSELLDQATMSEMKFDNSTPPYQDDFVIQTMLKQSNEPQGAVK